MLAFVAHVGAAAFHGFCSDEAQFTDADAGGGEGLQNEGEAVLTLAFSGANEADVFLAGELAARVGKKGALNFEGLDDKIATPAKFEPAVHSGEHGIDGGWGVVLFKVFFPSN